MSKKNIRNFLIGAGVAGVSVYALARFVLKLNFTNNIGEKNFTPGYRSPNQVRIDRNKEAFHKHRDDWILEVEDYTYPVSIITEDDYKQYGHMYLQKDAREDTPWIIIVHGYRGSEGESQTHASFFYKLGYNILTYSLRAHGTSEGHYITMADKEASDLIIWTNKIASNYPDAKIIYHGTSMGGATVINAAGRSDLPDNVAVIIDDCGYDDTWDMIGLEGSKRLGISSDLFFKVVNVAAKSEADTDFSTNKPIEAVNNIDIPILYIHGEEDDYVPTYMSRNLYDRTKSPKDIITPENAAHAQSHLVLGESYYTKINEFIKQFI